MSDPRLLWIDKAGQPVITTTANGERNARRWGWTPAQAIPAAAPEVRRAEAHAKLDALGADLDLLVDVAASGIPADVLRPILRTYSHAAIDVIPRPLGSIPGGVA